MKGMFKELPWLGKPLEDSILIFINAQQAALNDELRSGDVLDLITPAAGG
jgi:molybdopterin converting factor small subunit